MSRPPHYVIPALKESRDVDDYHMVGVTESFPGYYSRSPLTVFLVPFAFIIFMSFDDFHLM